MTATVRLVQRAAARPAARLLAAVTFAWALAAAALPACAEPALRASMNRLVEAMRTRDVAALLELMPRSGRLAVTSTIATPARTSTFTAEQVRRDLDSGTGLYELLFGFRGDDAWRDVFELTAFEPWRARSRGVFVPPGASYADGRHFVRWRHEGARWVIAEIGLPDS